MRTVRLMRMGLFGIVFGMTAIVYLISFIADKVNVPSQTMIVIETGALIFAFPLFLSGFRKGFLSIYLVDPVRATAVQQESIRGKHFMWIAAASSFPFMLLLWTVYLWNAGRSGTAYLILGIAVFSIIGLRIATRSHSKVSISSNDHSAGNTLSKKQISHMSLQLVSIPFGITMCLVIGLHLSITLHSLWFFLISLIVGACGGWILDSTIRAIALQLSIPER